MSQLTPSIAERITSLPPLPDSLLKIEEICRDPDSGIVDLVKVVQADPFLTANLLKTANSPYYGYGGRITSVSQAVSLFGMTTVWGFALAAAIRKDLKFDLTPYGVTPEGFAKSAERESGVMWNWYAKLNFNMGDVLVPTAFVGRVGMVVIAAEVVALGQQDNFRRDIEAGENWHEVERKYTNTSTPDVGAEIFTHWSFDPLMAAIVRASESPKTAEAKIRPYAYALKIVQTVVKKGGGISRDSTKLGVLLAKEAGFDVQILLKAIEKVVKPVSDDEEQE